MDAVSPVSSSPVRPAAVPRDTTASGPPPGPSTAARAQAPLPRTEGGGPPPVAFDAPPPPLAVQREQLRPPEPALMTPAQMTELLSRMLLGRS